MLPASVTTGTSADLKDTPRSFPKEKTLLHAPQELWEESTPTADVGSARETLVSNRVSVETVATCSRVAMKLCPLNSLINGLEETHSSLLPVNSHQAVSERPTR